MDDIGKIWDGLMRIKLETVALFAVNHADFRSRAKVPQDLEDVVTGSAELAAELESADMDPLSHDELAFCIGWARLAETMFGDDDTRLVDALKAEVSRGGPAG